MSSLCPAAGSVVCGVLLSNTGNMRLANITILGDTNDCKTSLLEPKADMACSMWRTVTQEDFDTGVVVVSATGASAFPRGPQQVLPAVPGDSATVALNQTASMDLSAKGDNGFVAVAGDSVLVTFTAANTGSVTLTNTSFSISTALDNISCNSTSKNSTIAVQTGNSVQLPRLGVGSAVSCTGFVVFNQGKLEAGTVTVWVNGTASDPAGKAKASASSQDVLITPINTPAMALDLIVVNCSLPRAAGGSAQCPVVVTNTGNVGLVNVSVAIDGCAVDLLLPKQQHVCQLQQQIDQDAFDAADSDNSTVQLSVTATAVARGSNNTAMNALDTDSLSLQAVLHPAANLSTTVSPASIAAAGKSCARVPLCLNNTQHDMSLQHISVHGFIVTLTADKQASMSVYYINCEH